MKQLLKGLFLSVFMNAFAQDIERDTVLGKTTLNLVNGVMLAEVHNAFEEMQKAALLEGIQLQVVSGYRSYKRQREIWNAKFLAFSEDGLTPQAVIQKIITYSTLPGTSRHHWGTDIDIIDASHEATGDVLMTEKFYGDGPYSKLRVWMEKNASNYGFVIVYTNDVNRKGFAYEPWHYSYKSIAKKHLTVLTQQALPAIANDEKLLGREYLDESFFTLYKTQHLLDINPVLIDRK